MRNRHPALAYPRRRDRIHLQKMANVPDSVGDMVPILPAEQASPPLDSASTSKHVSEMLPVIPTESAAPSAAGGPTNADWWQAAPPVRGGSGQPAEPPPASAPPSPPPPATWWRDAPPPVRNPKTPTETPAPAESTSPSCPSRGSPTPAEPTRKIRPTASAPAETQQMPILPSETPDQPRELPPGVWEPPPVRRGSVPGDDDSQTVSETAASETHRPRLSKRRAWFVITGLFLLTFGVLGGVGAWAWLTFHRSEEARLKEAQDDYKQGSFSKAESEFRELAHKFPDSARAKEYGFLADWSAVCGTVSNPDGDPAAAAVRLEQFIKRNEKDPLMSQKGRDAGQQLLKLATRFAARNAKPPDEQPLKAADRIEQLRRTVAALGADALTKEEMGQIEAEVGKVRLAVEKARKRRDVLAAMQKGNKETPMEAIQRVRDLLARMEHELPGINQDPEARAALERLYQTHLDSVVYQPEKQDGGERKPDPLVEDNVPTLLFASLLPTAAPGNAPEKDPIVLALVRGVLYALKQSNGELKWAIRVGIDTTVLPQRVPASQASPELLLVLSADTQTLSALNTEGDSLWEYPVGQRVLGRPIIIGQRAYLAAYDGWVHEIELSRGQLLGRWRLGQRLTRGGAREGDTSRIYFPADDSCIYVLDVNPQSRRCVTILYDGHRSGSLRSEPVIIPPEGNNAPGYLILNQVSGLDAMRLRVFPLPLQDRHAAPLPLNPPARLPGWTWFEPNQDGEKLAVLSDAGILGLFGIRQLGNRDQALFPMLQPGGLDLSRFLQNERELPRERGRAQVVHMQGNDLWVLAHGRFQQVHLGWKDASGLQATPGWKTPLPLGSPLHEPQCLEEPNGRSTFVLVTQALEQQTCLASKVDEQGTILWQRQLGLVCQGQPLVLTPPGGGSPLVLALDQGGGLVTLDPLLPRKPRSLAPALDENPRVPPRLLPAPDGHSAYEVAAPGDGRSLFVRRIEWRNGERSLHVKESRASLVSLADGSVLTPAGAPAVVGTQLIMPMTDGKLMRLALADEKLQQGPNWRDRLAPVTASCHVLALGGDRFLFTNGSRGLLVYDWPLGKDFQPLPKEGELPRPLPYLVAAPPVLLPPRDGQPPRVAVADSAGMLHLFVIKPDGSLQPGLVWEIKGKLTTGPFVHVTAEGSLRLGCVLDRRRLVWIDPAKAKPLWEYPSESAALVGQPRQIEDLLVVALQSGHYVGLDPSTGQAKGPGYRLRTSAAPAATPFPFGPGRMCTL